VGIISGEVEGRELKGFVFEHSAVKNASYEAGNKMCNKELHCLHSSLS